MNDSTLINQTFSNAYSIPRSYRSRNTNEEVTDGIDDYMTPSSSSSSSSSSKPSTSPSSRTLETSPELLQNINKPTSANTYQRLPVSLSSFIFPDMRALYSLDLDSYMDLTYEEIQLFGYEIYIVEQWTSERKLSTIITSLTGNRQDIVTAVRVVLPSDPKLWPGRFKQYYEELMKFSQPKVMPQGTLFLTNISSMESSLNLLHVECGDLRIVWPVFEINYDLKTLHCAGRSALLLCYPSNASEEKFSQLYKIPIPKRSGPLGILSKENNLLKNEHGNEFTAADLKNNMQQQVGIVHGLRPPALQDVKRGSYPVIELITLIQISLNYFKLRGKNIVKDGLLCNGTKRAIGEWWDNYGKLYLGVEKPRNEATLGPTTVAALISLVLSCYFKLIVENCINSGDPYDENEFLTGIHNFQKKYDLLLHPGRPYLDHRTLEKLFEMSAKFSNRTDIFKFKKLVKSRMQDIVGKGNPIYLSNEILTTDIGTLINNIHGGSLGLLFKGKGRCGKDVNLSPTVDFTVFKFQHGNPSRQLEQHQRDYKEFKQKKKEQLSKKRVLQFDDRIDETMDDTYTVDQNTETADGNLGAKDVLSKFDARLRRVPLSSATISSMFCNYDRSKYLQSACINELYQKEYYRRNSLPLINDHLNDSVNVEQINATSNTTKYKTPLFRCNSSSRIQNVIEKWEIPFDPSAVRMARDIVKIENRLHSQKTEEEKEVAIEKVGEYLEFDDATTSLQQIYQKYVEGAKSFQTKSNDLENKQQMLLREMHELNSLTMKLKYDIRILELRVRDVEDSVNQFDSKLKTMKSFVVKESGTKESSNLREDDKVIFQHCVNNLLNTNTTNYQGSWLSVLSKRFFWEVKQDMLEWYEWLFKNGIYQESLKQEKRI